MPARGPRLRRVPALHAPAPSRRTERDERRGERAARQSLREQIARLESQIGQAVASAYPRLAPPPPVPGFAGPRLLGLEELERTRDELAAQLHDLRSRTCEQADRQAAKRLLVERMLLDPARYKWVRVSGADIGEHACKHWHVRPRLGLIGMLAGWWQVKISAGCPLAAARRARRTGLAAR
jgi:hypothetical protein